MSAIATVESLATKDDWGKNSPPNLLPNRTIESMMLFPYKEQILPQTSPEVYGAAAWGINKETELAA